MSKRIINRWISEINKVLGSGSNDNQVEYQEDDDYDPNTLVGAFKEVGDQFKDVGSELLGAFGFKPSKKSGSNAQAQSPVKVSRKCISCSAPLVGYQGKSVKCKYCDTDQTL